MEVKIYTTFDSNLLEDWKNLWEKSGKNNAVSSPGWFQAAYNAFRPKSVAIVTVYTKTKNLIAIAPFFKSNLFGSSVFTFPAREFAFQDALLIEEDSLEAFYSLLKGVWQLGNVLLSPLDYQLAKLIHNKERNSYMFLTDKNPYINLSQYIYGDFPEKKRKNLLNRIQKIDVPVYLLNTTEYDKKKLDLIFHIDKESNKQLHGKGVFYRKDVQEFYIGLFQNIPSKLMTSLLYFGDIPIAYTIGFLSESIYIGSQKAYLSGYEYFNPGKILQLKLLDYCDQQNIKTFSFGFGYDRFKLDFTKNASDVYSVIISKNLILRYYLLGSLYMRKKLYTQCSKSAKVYSLYKKIKGKVSK